MQKRIRKCLMLDSEIMAEVDARRLETRPQISRSRWYDTAAQEKLQREKGEGNGK